MPILLRIRATWQQFTSLLITTSMTPDISQVEQTIGGPPLNSDGSPGGHGGQVRKDLVV